MGITSEICGKCGTELLVDMETDAKVHRDVTYKECTGGDEAWGDALAEALTEIHGPDLVADRRKTARSARRRHLRAI